jgi:demethylmenaquinone methyltransferase/2-methoxy-6-polyprenyl-1,4-benzoquinol methylase
MSTAARKLNLNKRMAWPSGVRCARAYHRLHVTRPEPSSSRVVWSASDLADDPHTAADKAQRVRAMFAAIARSYDLNNRVHSLGRDRAWRRKAVGLCAVKSTDDVLDVACGTGDLAEAFAAAGPASVTGVDFTEPMLELAERKAEHIERHADVPTPEYRFGDAMDLAFEDGSVDVVSIAFGIRNVTDPPRALAEFRRVLRPGGRLVILEFSRPRNPILGVLSDVYLKRVMPITAAWLARDRSGAYRYLPRSVSTFADRAELAEMMADAGFAPVTQHPMTFGICVGYLGHVPG